MKVGIAGATAYTSLELIKLLLKHPRVEIAYLGTRREGSPKISEIFPSLKRLIELPCAGLEPEDVHKGMELLFVTLPPKVSMNYVPKYLKRGMRVIDFSADYRFKDAGVYEKWYKVPHTDPEGLKEAVYGLPELYRKELVGASLVSNPGCYPVSTILPLAPLLKKGLVDSTDIIIDSKSGVSGRGRDATEASHYCECNENIEAYSVGAHRHTPEIEEVLSDRTGMRVKVYFTPHLVPMDRGILSTIYARLKGGVGEETLREVLRSFYKEEPFIRLKEPGEFPRTKEVTNTNFCDISLKVVGERVILLSAIDNLIKGASGQAVQNMNVMFGFEEVLGLL
ncbi:MAG TPA: N-acetyl-gamma-glutamyl-phosphate reductase [Candidatus Hypogeohydataceae bacterium YC41]